MARTPRTSRASTESVALIAAGDKLDIYSANDLLDACRARLDAPACLTIDLAGAERIHTAAMQVLVAVATGRAAAGLEFELRGISPAVRATLALTGLDSVLDRHAGVLV